VSGGDVRSPIRFTSIDEVTASLEALTRDPLRRLSAGTVVSGLPVPDGGGDARGARNFRHPTLGFIVGFIV
jgi:hypothetical protein